MTTDKKPSRQVISVDWVHAGVGPGAQMNICEQTLAQATYSSFFPRGVRVGFVLYKRSKPTPPPPPPHILILFPH